MAFALVWVEDDSPALNTNEAYAFASCTNCAAVSVGFQIVLVTGDNHVAVPQNISAAVNYDCVNCLTYALATQLFVTLDGPLSDAGTKQIAALWEQIADFGTHITEVPLSEIRDRLTTYEQQILAIINADEGAADPDAEQAGAPARPTRSRRRARKPPPRPIPRVTTPRTRATRPGTDTGAMPAPARTRTRGRTPGPTRNRHRHHRQCHGADAPP